MSSITLKVLSGADDSTIIDLSTNDRFAVRGQKMYIWKLEDMIDVLTKDEFKELIRLFKDTKLYNKANVLKVSFSKATSNMRPVARSRLKRKLKENGIIIEYNKKIMINPYILLPRNDKNVKNFQHLVQRTYKYLANDKDLYFDGIEDFVEYIFVN